MDSKLFNHFVITRFNLKVKTWHNDKKGQLVNNDVWLKERYKLFENFCYPSIQMQTEKNFKWLVYFDLDTPRFYIEKNIQLVKKCPNFIPMYASSHDDFVNKLSEDINANVMDRKPYIITTRLDNDDGLHKNAIKTVQNNFKEIDQTIIDLCNGLCLQYNKKTKLSKKKVTFGPFISLISKFNLDEKSLTVYDKAHRTWDNVPNYIGVIKGYFWIQIIHDRNLLNSLTNELTFNKFLLRGFDFLKPVSFSFKYYLFIIFKQIKKQYKVILKK